MIWCSQSCLFEQRGEQLKLGTHRADQQAKSQITVVPEMKAVVAAHHSFELRSLK